MNNNQQLIWRAMSELGDFFSRLGGAARPFNMVESEIQLYICYKLLKFNNIPINEEEYLNQQFIDAAKPVIEKADSYLRQIQLDEMDIFPFVQELYEYANKKLKEPDKTSRWFIFGKYLSEKHA